MLPIMNILRFFRQTCLELLRVIFKFKKPLAITDPTAQYIHKNVQQFHRILTKRPADAKDYNDNIEKIVYIKKEFFETLADPENPLENLWKKRILIENTPRGNIYMYYDIFKQGFAYYSDQTGIPYRILNAVAMKYVVVFRCIDFFLDETGIPDGKTSPLVKVFVEDDEEEKKQKKAKMENLQIDMNNAPFAKFKTYTKDIKKLDNNLVTYGRVVPPGRGWYRWIGWLTSFLPGWKRLFPSQLPEVSSQAVLENLAPKKDKIINKFIFLGHSKNFNPLQIPVLTRPTLAGFSTHYDAMFSKVQKISYKDFKSQFAGDGKK
jgi:hypothetical protein